MSAARHPWRAVVVWLALGLALALLFVAAVFSSSLLPALGLARSGAPTTVPASFFDAPTPEAESSPASGAPFVVAAPTGGEGSLPDRAALEARLNSLDTAKLQAGVPEGESLVTAYEVLDAVTGEVMASSNADQALIPASNTKLLTVVAVLSAFDGTETFTTRVVSPEPGRIVLVGGGDPLLSSVPNGAYPGHASMQQLAEATAAKLIERGTTSVTVGYDATLFQEAWATTWPGNYRDQVTPLSALWVDEGRDANRVRSADPAVDAAALFVAQLTAAGITVEGAPTAEAGSGEEIASVSSAPVHAIAEVAMESSNNSYTEVLGMQLALRAGQPATFAGSVVAIQQELTALGIWADGAVLHDASGLTRDNRVPTAMLARAMRHVMTTPKLSVVLDGLPVAGVSGSLSDRFIDEVSQPARGVARAKTGTLSLVATLAGTTVTADGRELAFAFITNGSTDGWAARVWADQGVGQITGCGCS
ncbi:MAG: D-alanyl-D-alanine carboxypeptidase/D-alanyl-D-alanine-endopeptidase [Propionibacteriaceae bacterium]|nr:D-alanyl-D-alanine carboxypeptidase/D-alanyl-D-alanine-endopeptidase [Propionibacteriaceae bacterium]